MVDWPLGMLVFLQCDIRNCLPFVRKSDLFRLVGNKPAARVDLRIHASACECYDFLGYNGIYFRGPSTTESTPDACSLLRDHMPTLRGSPW